VFLIENNFLIVVDGGWTERGFVHVLVFGRFQLFSQLLVFFFENVEVHLVSIFQKYCQFTILLNEGIFLGFKFFELRISLIGAVLEVVILLLYSTLPEMLSSHCSSG
jgi:hypothetical protein